MQKNTITSTASLRKLICFVLITLAFAKLSAQPNNYKLYTSRQILKMAKDAQQRGDYYNAIELFKYYLEKKEGNMDIYYQLAENYRKSRDYVNASVYYKRVIDTNADVYPHAYYHYADMLMQQARYEDALKAFEAAKKKRLDKALSDRIKQKSEGCKLALKQDFIDQRTHIIHPDTSINQANTELSPAFLNYNEIIYSSIKGSAIEKYPVNPIDLKLPVSQFYVAEKVNDTVWKPKGKWNFNDELMHVGNGAFSYNGNRFYFTKCRRDWDNVIRCSIYYSDKGYDGWTAPVALDNTINLPGYTTTQLAVGRESKRNREVLYFVSDRPQGKGGMDIWYTVYDNTDGTFSKPANAGLKINTKGDEVTPFYDFRSGTLFFSSDYLPGYGGFDVFSSTGEPRNWTLPVNIGRMINSENDELYYTINPQKRNEGMFVSNRKGSVSALHETCCDDIYYYRKEKIDKIFVKGKILQEELIADSVFADSEVIASFLSDMGSESIIIDSSMVKMVGNKRKHQEEKEEFEMLSKAIISIYMIDSITQEEIFIYSDSTNEQGEYLHELEPLKNYKIVIKKDEFFNQNLYVTTKMSDWRDTIVLQNIALKPVPRKPLKMTVYYDVNSEKLKDESKQKIDTTLLNILKESPELIVEISSYTDSIGPDLYNKKLSQKRAEIVVKYLIEKGIDKNRLIAVGYGETNPIADNITEAGRALNRRTEFKVVGSIDQFSKLNVTDLKIIRKDGRKEEAETKD
jgi:outer membrane protein OmpA-like peptidoglycan-associated protein